VLKAIEEIEMKRFVVPVLAAMALFLAGCAFFPAVTGSGTPTTASYGLAGFSGIQASQAFKVHVIPDSFFSVDVTCDDNLVRYLRVDTTSGGTLRLALEQGYNYRFITVSAEVHMPAVSMLDASGASDFDVEAGFASSAPLSISLSGASSATVAGIVCGDLTVDISGASTATLAGSAFSHRIMASGASNADLMSCSAPRADVTLSGASDAWVNVGSGLLSLSASGASTLYYAGTPVFSLYNLSGTSRTVKVR
jgi:hypothetical protein